VQAALVYPRLRDTDYETDFSDDMAYFVSEFVLVLWGILGTFDRGNPALQSRESNNRMTAHGIHKCYSKVLGTDDRPTTAHDGIK
jgi:hypothetical protein